MSTDIREKLKNMKMIKVREGTPEDLKIAIQTFVQQAIIVGEHNLDHMPPEYLDKLLTTMSKYPEYNNATMGLMEVLQRDDL